MRHLVTPLGFLALLRPDVKDLQEEVLQPIWGALLELLLHSSCLLFHWRWGFSVVHNLGDQCSHRPVDRVNLPAMLKVGEEVNLCQPQHPL